MSDPCPSSSSSSAQVGFRITSSWAIGTNLLPGVQGRCLAAAPGSRSSFPRSALAQKSLVLSLGARSTVAGGHGPLELPRVRPVTARIIDDAWLAWADQDHLDPTDLGPRAGVD